MFANLDSYEKLTPRESWDAYNWGLELKEGSTVYHLLEGNFEAFVGEPAEGYYSDPDCKFTCEVTILKGEGFYEGCCDGDLLGEGFGPTPEDAVKAAFAQVGCWKSMRENDNCEDAVNCGASIAYELLQGDMPLYNMDKDEVDELMGRATDIVKREGKSWGIEWVDYQAYSIKYDDKELEAIMASSKCCDDALLDIFGTICSSSGFWFEYEENPEPFDEAMGIARAYVEGHMDEYGIGWA